MVNLNKDSYSVEDGEGSTKEKGCNYSEFLDNSFKAKFHRLGVAIGHHPWYFIVIPILICLGLGTGLHRFYYINDPEYLFAPVQGQAKDERSIMEQYFPVNYTRFHPSRIVRPGRLARIIITAKDDGNLLRQSIWTEIKELDDLIHNITVLENDEEFRYETLCASFAGQCYETDVLEIGELMQGIEEGTELVTYPIMLNAAKFKTYIIPLSFGGVVVNNQSNVESIQALQAFYLLKVDTPDDERRGIEWEGHVLDLLEKTRNKWNSIKVHGITWRTYGEEIDKNPISAIPYMAITIPLVVLFAAGSCMSHDWVRAKPWLGFVGIGSAMLGTLGGFGLVCYCGTPMISINVAAPFLMLGIGIDDCFVMLASWRQTSVRDPVPKRLGEAYAEAAVSITITSLTDMLSFIVGIAAPFQAVRIFSIYTGAAVVGTYLCHLLIFGAAMAITGRIEAKNKHGLFWWQDTVTKSKIDPNKSWLYRHFYIGGSDPNDPYNPINEREHSLMIFFRDYWATWLNKPKVKALVLVLFLLYIGLAGWGISKTEEGLELPKLSQYGSESETYFKIEDKYFREYPYRVQIVVTGDLEYSNKTVQDNIENMMQELETSKFVKGASLFTESWLRNFLRYAERLKSVDLELNLTSEAAFIDALKENYLGPSSVYTEDVKFNEDETKIIAARFIIQTTNISNAIEDTEMVTGLREITAARSPEMNVTIFNPYFIFFDQYSLIRSTTIQCVVVAGLIMMVVSLIFIPNPLCSLWVVFSILSIEAGVLGFLALWNVNLDAISMMNLIMCIGFSVDFSAHISYAYMSAKVESPDERVKACLYSLGIPIVQGAVSTILGVLTLLFAPSYILNTFFKAIVLVMIIAALHGLLLLPVLLSIFVPCRTNCCKDGEDKMEMENKAEFEDKYTKCHEVGVTNGAYVGEKNEKL